MTRLPFDPDPLEVTDDYQRGYTVGWDDGHDCTASHEHGRPTALAYLLLASMLVAGVVAGFLAAQVFAAAPRPATQVELARSFPGWRTGAPHERGSSPQDVTPSPTPVATADPATTAAPLELVTRTGILSHMGAGWPADYLALPIGPGHRVELCGAGGCLELVSTDAGPAEAMLDAGRIADASVEIFEAVCGVPASRGLCPVTWTVVG